MKGLIYLIKGYGLQYYGSTITSLENRRLNHESHVKNRDKRRWLCTSVSIIEQGDDWTMEEIEEIEFDDIHDLRLKESEYIKNNECVNRYRIRNKDEIKEYKREWAEKFRREKGCKIKSEMTLTKDPDYQAKWARDKRANETDEKKEERLKARREAYANKPQTEEQKEKARLRSQKARDAKKRISQ